MIKIFFAFLVLLNFSLVEAKSDLSDSRIVGGVEATPGEMPFIVSLQTDGRHFCGGSLIGPDVVLTAAHCVLAVNDFEVAIGLHSLRDVQKVERFDVKNYLLHPNYGVLSKNDSDFAIVKLAGRSKFKPILLNNVEISIPDQSSNEFAIRSVTAGWGVLSEEGGGLSLYLQKVEVPLVDSITCNKAYNGKITDQMLCAGFKEGKKDSCQGDSGGPLFVTDSDGNKILVGVVSWGQGCARPEKYGVYSKVSSVIDWISSNSTR